MIFTDELRQQRWDDHRYYHRSRINQFLHLLSACSFLASYVLLFVDHVTAVMVGWLLAMLLRQAGHFFFEPKTYDEVNDASHEYKESIKVGYNLKRKIILLSAWVLSPAVLLVDPTCFNFLDKPIGMAGVVSNVAALWLVVGGGAIILRTFHLFFLMGVQSGLVWFVKILTDPFHDVKIYYKSPYYLLKGKWYDDMSERFDTPVAAAH